MDLKEEQAIGGDPAGHWYYISKGRAIKQLLGDAPVETLLDVGAGSGVFSQMLVEEGRAARAICVDPNYDDAFIVRHATDRIDFVRAIGAADPDVVLMIDVIEHVDDDVALIADYVARVRPGARFLISVPAFQFLWSSHDVFLEHRRRYTLKTLEAAVRGAGLEPVDLQYFFGLMFPAVAAARAVDRVFASGRAPQASQLKPAPAWLNAALVAVHDLERAALFGVNRLAGVSAFCLAEKRG